MIPPKQHLVARCPTCTRPIWNRRLAALLGFDSEGAKRLVPNVLGFFAVIKPGKQGWHRGASFANAAELGAACGNEPVELLKRLARQSLQRMWMFGLLTAADLRDVSQTQTLAVERVAPQLPESHAVYELPARAAPPPRPARTEQHEVWKPPPAPPPSRAAQHEVWKP